MNQRGGISFAPELSEQVRRVVLARFLMAFGCMSSYFIGVMGTLTFTMGQGVVESALAVGMINMFQMIGNAKGGELLDRFGPTKHFRITVALFVTCGLAFQILSLAPVGVLMGAAYFGFSFGVGDMISRSYPAYLSSDRAELQRINSSLMFAINVAVVVGPLVGGAISLVASTRAVFLLLAACAVLSLIPGWGIKALCAPEGQDVEDLLGSATNRESPADRVKREGIVKAGFSTIFSSAALTLLFWSTLLSFLGYGAFDPLESLYYRDVLKVGAEWMGWLSAIVGVGGILGTVAAGLLPGHRVNTRSLLITLFAMGAGCLVYVGTASVWVAAVGQFVLGFFNGAFIPIRDTLVQMHTPLDRMGRVTAAMNMGYNVAGVVPLLCAPLIAEFIGVQGTLIAASLAVTLVPLGILLIRHRALDRIMEEELAS